MERAKAISRVYSQTALQQAGAFVRLNVIEDEVAYLKRFIREHPEPNGRSTDRWRTKKARKVAMAAPPAVVEAPRSKRSHHKGREPEIGNGFSVAMTPRKHPAVMEPGRRPSRPASASGKSMRTRCREIVGELQASHPDGVRPVHVAERLQAEGWRSNDKMLHSVQSALRQCEGLLQRKDGENRSAAVFYTVKANG